MVYGSLHESITRLAWDEAEAILDTPEGKEMAKESHQNELPLHMALERRAPDRLVSSLLAAWPTAASVAGRRGALPLCVAVSRRDRAAAVVAGLIEAHPEALDAPSFDRRAPRLDDEAARDALRRPVACWIEDAERRRYYAEAVSAATADARTRVARTREATKWSRARRADAERAIASLTPRAAALERSVASDERRRTQLADLKRVMKMHVHDMRNRVTEIEKQLTSGRDDDDDDDEGEIHMMNSVLKREYAEKVRNSYDKLTLLHQKIKCDLKLVKSFLKDQLTDEKTTS